MKTSVPANDCYNLVTKFQSFTRFAATILAGAVRFGSVLMTALIFWMSTSHLRADSVTVTITVDNGYGFGFGDQNGIYDGKFGSCQP